MTTITRNLNDQVKTSTLWPTHKPSASTPPSYCNIIRNYIPLASLDLNASLALNSSTDYRNIIVIMCKYPPLCESLEGGFAKFRSRTPLHKTYRARQSFPAERGVVISKSISCSLFLIAPIQDVLFDILPFVAALIGGLWLCLKIFLLWSDRPDA